MSEIPSLIFYIPEAFLSEMSQDTGGEYNRLAHGHQIRRAKKKATMLNDKRIKTCIDKFAAGVYSRYEFLSAVSHMADNLPTEQLADVNSSDDDETETYDVDEALAATTSNIVIVFVGAI